MKRVGIIGGAVGLAAVVAGGVVVMRPSKPEPTELVGPRSADLEARARRRQQTLEALQNREVVP